MKIFNLNKTFFLLAANILFCMGTAFGSVRLPAIFSDKMVLQQQSWVDVWGWADVGEQITITATWASQKSVSTKTDALGRWQLVIQTPPAGGPYLLIIKGNNMIELTDVLIGEVWLCSGQSNMVFSLKGDAEAKTEIPNADYPAIRFFNVKRQYGPELFADAPGSEWQVTTPQTAPSFSAVAFYFAQKIHRQLNVPVGIVYAAWGGTPAEAWTPAEVFQKDQSLQIYKERWNTILQQVGKDSAAYKKSLAQWEKNSAASKKPAEPQTFYYYKRPWREPSVLFNGMINPVIPYTIKGVLWYQGESNVFYADEYAHLFGAMINSWRMHWKKPAEMPFYFVQIAPFGYSNMDAAARLRAAQYKVMKNISNTGMAVTIDVGEMKDQHFNRKKPVGYRLALIALSKDYAQKKIIYKGPEIKNAFTKKEKVVVRFQPSSAGLRVAGDTLNGFEVGYSIPGQDSIQFVKAHAKVKGKKIIVWHPQVQQPLVVRYAWLFPGEANLMNNAGLPAFPFTQKIDKEIDHVQ